MNLQKAIFRMEGIFNLSLAERIINYIDSEELKLLSTSGGLNKNVRNVSGFTAQNNQLNTISKKEMSKYIFFNFIKKELSVALMNYQIKFSEFNFSDIQQTDFLKYSEGGKYEIHSDDSARSVRRLTIIVNLNKNYEGGDFIFFDPINKKEIIHRENLNKGTVLAFPSNFLYPHSIEPIKSGTRYSLVSWAL
jgi:predicted 2-oxoglutarate/Fe(II)-dependent dioxygenase YbiX